MMRLLLLPLSLVAGALAGGLLWGWLVRRALKPESVL